MNKELESLKEIKKYFPFKVNELEYQNIDIIETALKNYENLKQENEQLKTSYLENLLNEESKEYIYKKLKALDTIKERFTIQFSKSDLPNYYGIMQIGTNPVYIKTQEEYDLLKEVLL